MQYDPDKHDGLISVNGKMAIITNAQEADLGALPEDVKRAIKDDTIMAIELLNRGGSGSILQFDGIEDERQWMIEGYRRGLALL
jgi:hypothetical protein